jgi:hypothetical protein
MNYLDEIANQKISALEMAEALKSLKTPPYSAGLVLDDSAVNLILGLAEHTIGQLRGDDIKASSFKWADFICNTFTAGMIAGLKRAAGEVPQSEVYDFLK